MATTFTVQAGAKVQAKAVGWSNTKKVAWGTVEISDSGPTAANSVVYMWKIPKGAVLTGGRVYGDR